MFVLRPTSTIFIITCLGVLFSYSHTDAAQDWTTSEKDCVKKIESIDSLENFLNFSDDLDVALKDNTNQQLITQTINGCVNSVYGLGDINLLEDIVELLEKIHSVCEPYFVSKLLLFSKRMRNSRTHKLAPFFRLLTGQVIVTCKKNLKKKLEQAEQIDEVVQSLQVVDEMLNPNVSNDEFPFGESMRYLMEKIMDSKSRTPVLPEDILLAESIKSSDGEPEVVRVTLNSQEMLERFATVKKACIIIDFYAEASINPISRLALDGYFARDESAIVDDNLKNSSQVIRWLNAVQHCQSVFITEAHVDIEREIPESLEWEELNKEKTGLFEWFRFKDIETFDEFDRDIRCHTAPTPVQN